MGNSGISWEMAFTIFKNLICVSLGARENGGGWMSFCSGKGISRFLLQFLNQNGGKKIFFFFENTSLVSSTSVFKQNPNGGPRASRQFLCSCPKQQSQTWVAKNQELGLVIRVSPEEGMGGEKIISVDFLQLTKNNKPTTLNTLILTMFSQWFISSVNSLYS